MDSTIILERSVRESSFLSQLSIMEGVASIWNWKTVWFQGIFFKSGSSVPSFVKPISYQPISFSGDFFIFAPRALARSCAPRQTPRKGISSLIISFIKLFSSSHQLLDHFRFLKLIPNLQLLHKYLIDPQSALYGAVGGVKLAVQRAMPFENLNSSI